MNDAALAPTLRRRRWPRRLLVLLVLVAVAIWWLQSPYAGRFLLRQAGAALGLDIRAGTLDYRLRGTPQLQLHDVVAQRPGDAVPLLCARRLLLALPWKTLRTRGASLVLQRIELDAPVLDIPALQRWLATRPPSAAPRIPSLTTGLRIRDGRIDNDDWRIDGVAIDLPNLALNLPLHARVRGRYLAAPISIPADLRLTITHLNHLLAGQASAVSGAGTLTLVDAGGWHIPAQVSLTGPLQIGKDSALMRPAKLGIAARYISASSDLPFQLGVYAPMVFNNAAWRFVPATLVLRGGGMIPNAQARGSVSVGARLRLHLDGALDTWPLAWPALPMPLAASSSTLPCVLDYQGAPAFSDAATLTLRRDATIFRAQFQLPEVLTWLDASEGSPLPPLSGSLTTPRIQIPGATLDGVQIEIDDTRTQ